MSNFGTIVLLHVVQFIVPAVTSPNPPSYCLNQPELCNLINFVHVLLRTIPITF